MAKKDSNKNKKGGNIRPIEEMIATQDSNAEKFLDKLEKLEKVAEKSEPIVEQIVEPMDEPIVQPIVEPIVESNQPETEKHELLKILNYNIKGALHYNKNKSTKGITSRHYKSILEAYERTTGLKMSDSQADYIKKINIEQAKSVLYTFNMFNKKFNSKRELAEQTN